jgi:uncharacterized protein YcbK (DUF882 family)
MPHHAPVRKPQEEPVPEKKISYDDLMRNASFSPELAFLLAMTLKDGMRKDNVLDMLEKIEPYVSKQDRDAIHSILGAKNMTEEFRRSTPQNVPRHSPDGLSGFAKLTRQNALLNILQNYASHDTGSMMRNLQQSVQMQENFARMSRRLEVLRNTKDPSPEQMLDAISLFVSPENMMRMMGSMKNFKPEDMFKFMNNK